MSGICGIVRLDGKSVEKDEIQKILNAMHNCGHDAEGLWTEGSAGLGHKMLWVTPESLHESQPLVDDGHFVLTADARIDNRKELIEQLAIDEDPDKVITDIDLILQAYHKWGDACPEYLLGDYAFAIWDVKKQQLFCARDPMGIRSFYYYQNDEYFVFASEIHSIVEGMQIEKTPDAAALKDLLKLFFLPHENTFYKGIYRLPSAHTLSVSGKKRRLKRYWFPERIKIDKTLTQEDAIKKFDALFSLAINARLRSAYPVGSELSGGLDSSSIVAAACAEHGKDILTPFSLHYGNLKCDESQYSNALIEQYGLQAESIRSDLLDYAHTYTLDRYYAEDSDWPGIGYFIGDLPIMERAKELGIRVMLTGQGGDEIMAGSSLMLADYLKEGEMRRLYEELRYYNFSKKKIIRYLILPFLPEKIKNFLRMLLGKKRVKSNMNRQKSFFPDIGELPGNSSTLSQQSSLEAVAGVGASYLKSTGWNLCGRYDIEYCHPFFDKRLIEFSLSLPPYLKKEKGVSKKLLREAMGAKLPDIIRERRGKAEFTEMTNIQINALDLGQTEVYKIFDLGIIENRENFEKDMEAMRFPETASGKQRAVWNTILIEKWLQILYK